MKNKITPIQRALNLWAVILIVWSVYRANFKLPEWFDEFIAKPLVFVLPVFYYIKNIEKKEFFDAIWLKTKTLISDISFGLIIGLIFIGSAVLANFVKYHKIIFVNNQYNSLNLIYILLIALATGVTEEILSRGFVLKRLYEESKNIYSSSFFASILFFFLHVPILFTNAKITGNLLLIFMGVDMILSLVISFIYLKEKNLVLPILIHAFYNLTITLFI